MAKDPKCLFSTCDGHVKAARVSQKTNARCCARDIWGKAGQAGLYRCVHAEVLAGKQWRNPL